MNFIIDKSNRLSNDWVWEWHYYNSIFRYMNEDSFFQKFDVIFTDNLGDIEIKEPTKTIVFICSDEQYTVPKYVNKVKAIFKNYVTIEQEKLNIYPIPQGYNKSLIPFPIKNINKRIFDVSFQGNIHTTRGLVLQNIINEIQKNNINININIKNSNNMLDYSENLWNTKISLCLDGQITPENFRFFESSIFGCVIFASENLPKNWIYDSDHYIKVNWSNPTDIILKIQNILYNQAKLLEYSNASKLAWEDKYSAKSVYKYIKSKL